MAAHDARQGEHWADQVVDPADPQTEPAGCRAPDVEHAGTLVPAAEDPQSEGGVVQKVQDGVVVPVEVVPRPNPHAGEREPDGAAAPMLVAGKEGARERHTLGADHGVVAGENPCPGGGNHAHSCPAGGRGDHSPGLDAGCGLNHNPGHGPEDGCAVETCLATPHPVGEVRDSAPGCESGRSSPP